MAKLDHLKKAKSLAELAILLGFVPHGLSYRLYKVLPEQNYLKFEIYKRNGGIRQISAPVEPLKMLQRNLADLLYDCRAEIEAVHRRRPLSYGFRKSHSIIDNARLHKNRRYVLNLDIQDFFPTFNFGRVRGFFIKDRDYTLAPRVATIVAQIACFENGLPQGSPCSPVIADMLTHILDIRLLQLARGHRVTYSRYADDLTFSTNQKDFPEALAKYGDGREWTLSQGLVDVIEHSGFLINPAKTRMQVRTSRQLVTGLTVNTKVNIPQDYWRSVRAFCNALFQTGSYRRQDNMITSLNPLAGMLSHVYFVKRQACIVDPKTPEDKPPNIPENKTPSRTLYAKFLFFKYFVALEKPLILCEGKTDNIYLKYAIRHLEDFHPQLGQETDNGFEMAISLFRYTNQAHRILDITGGASNLHGLINRYRPKLAQYRYRPVNHAVVILLDNDKGLSGNFRNDLKKNFDVDVSLTSTDPFYHLTDNLYIVKTPEI